LILTPARHFATVPAKYLVQIEQYTSLSHPLTYDHWLVRLKAVVRANNGHDKT